jgi:hypothetical protein
MRENCWKAREGVAGPFMVIWFGVNTLQIAISPIPSPSMGVGVQGVGHGALMPKEGPSQTGSHARSEDPSLRSG